MQISEPFLTVVKVEVNDERLTLAWADGRTISVPIGFYPRLAYGTAAERQNFEICGAGTGVHWPDLDEDISAEGVLHQKRSQESPRSFERWLATLKAYRESPHRNGFPARVGEFNGAR